MGAYSKRRERNEEDEYEHIELLPVLKWHDDESDGLKQTTSFQTKSCNYEGGNFSHLKKQDVVFYLRVIILISWLSVLVCTGFGSASMVVSYRCNSPAAFGFAFNCITDVVSSFVVIWRFSSYHGYFNEEQSEKITLVALGTLFVVSCVFILHNSISSLVLSISKDSQNAEQFHMNLIDKLNTCEGVWGLSIAFLSGLIFLVITTAIVYIGIKLNSRSVKADGIIGIVALITTLSWFLSLVTMEIFPQLWFLEEAVGLFVGLFCLSYGIWLLSELVVLLRNGEIKQKVNRTN